MHNVANDHSDAAMLLVVRGADLEVETKVAKKKVAKKKVAKKKANMGMLNQANRSCGGKDILSSEVPLPGRSEDKDAA